MMKANTIMMSILVVWTASLFAENITREQADVIVQDYIESEAIQSGTLYVNSDAPEAEGIAITTSNGETFRAKYACLAYCLDESDPLQRRYFFVKEEDGSLLEVIANNDISELATSWALMGTTNLAVNSEKNITPLYPNPVNDWLMLPCNENTHVEIYDLKGHCLFSEMLLGESICRLNVSFLKFGIYMVNTGSETYRIIKN